MLELDVLPRLLACLSALTATGGCALQELVPASAQRSSFATDTGTTLAGTLELEAGVVYDPHSVFDLPLALKWGIDERSEVFLEQSPWGRMRDRRRTRHGRSDVRFGMRRRERSADLDEGRGVALGWETSVFLPQGSTGGFSSGETDFQLAGIIDFPRPGWTLTGWIEAASLGEPQGSGRDSRLAAAIVGGLTLSDSLSAYAEVFAESIPERNSSPVVAQLGLAWAESPVRTWDLAVESGLDEQGGATRLVGGLTYNLGALRRGGP